MDLTSAEVRWLPAPPGAFRLIAASPARAAVVVHDDSEVEGILFLQLRR